MADDKSLTENCVPWVFLSVETQEAMKFAKHGWLYWSGREWLSVRHPLWWSNTIYRAKPSPEIHARYINLYGELGPDQSVHDTMSEAIAFNSHQPRTIWKITFEAQGERPALELVQQIDRTDD